MNSSARRNPSLEVPIATTGGHYDSGAKASEPSQSPSRRRMDRRLPNLTRPATSLHDDLIVTFPHVPGKGREYDFGSLELPPDIAKLFAYAFRNYPGPLTHDSQQSFWYSIRAFADFVREDAKVNSVADLTSAMVGRYRLWLDQQTGKRSGALWSQTTRAKRLVDLRTLVTTIKIISPELLPSQIVFPAHCYVDRVQPPAPRRLNDQELKSLLWCCQQEIREIRERFEIGQQILSGERPPNHERHFCAALMAIQELNTVGFPTEAAMAERGLSGAMSRFGGLSCLRSYLSLTAETAIPFYVSLLLQLAGNVEPVLNLTRGCASQDPVDERYVMVEWEKPRAGPAPGRTQRRFFESSKHYAPPRLVSDLLSLTEPLVSRVPPCDRNRLFLCWRPKTGTFGLLTYGHMAYQAKKFFSRAAARIEAWNRAHPNRQRAVLPVFDLRDLRGSAATQHFLASGGDIRHVQSLLNHRSAGTTQTYINGPLTHDLNCRIVASLQRKMLDNLRKHRAAPGHSSHHGVAASASFGHECQNPVLPSIDGEVKRCPNFWRCQDCPGLVVTLNVESLASLLRFQKAFESARERLHSARWNFLYADGHQFLEGLLSLFPEKLMPEALALMATLPPIPEME